MSDQSPPARSKKNGLVRTAISSLIRAAQNPRGAIPDSNLPIETASIASLVVGGAEYQVACSTDEENDTGVNRAVLARISR